MSSSNGLLWNLPKTFLYGLHMGILVKKIDFDNDYWLYLIVNFNDFYRNCYVPSLF